MHAADAPFACENCGTALQGCYCHLCGQAATNPLRHVGHAVEEFFESFWHLDGRVFRTLRVLLRPGRVARDYLAGHRVRYIPPLRLFVMLSLLTFFVGKVVIGSIETDGTVRVGSNDAGIAGARTPVEVDERLERALTGIREGREQAGALPAVDTMMREAEAGLIAQARARKASLAGSGAAPAPSASAVAVPAGAPTDPDALRADFASTLQRNQGHLLRDPARPWHEDDNPLDFDWLPGFGDRWLNGRIANSARNIDRIQRDPAYFLQSTLAAVPPALFVLVPVFALLLKLFYFRSRRAYLEHLVVALYSHSFLLLALLALFVLEALELALAANAWPAAVTGLLRALVWCSIPVYLLVMQKRVYAQSWAFTALKYVTIGLLYLFLLVGVLLYAMFATITGG
jgi:hypothetical protein